METDTTAVKEWAWELKSETSALREQTEQVGLLRNVPRYRGQDIRVYPTIRDYLP